MSLEKPTYRESLRDIRAKLYAALVMTEDLKNDIEHEVERMDERRVSKRPKSQKWHDKYLRLCDATDELHLLTFKIAAAESMPVSL